MQSISSSASWTGTPAFASIAAGNTQLPNTYALRKTSMPCWPNAARRFLVSVACLHSASPVDDSKLSPRRICHKGSDLSAGAAKDLLPRPAPTLATLPESCICEHASNDPADVKQCALLATLTTLTLPCKPGQTTVTMEILLDSLLWRERKRQL